ncbi:MAG: type IV pilin protein [Chitinophagaceae bacterium]|nr:type IV pilin protein [Rubrivivax sp.]
MNGRGLHDRRQHNANVTNSSSPPHRHPSRLGTARGFTLIELLIAVVVLAVVTALALPSFNAAIRKSRRADAVAALTAVQQAQERWRTNQSAFAGAAQLTPLPAASPPGLGLPELSPSGYYGVAIAAASATGYVATAAAVSGTSQANDGTCALLGVRMDAGNVGYGSGASTIDWTDPNRCWAR